MLIFTALAFVSLIKLLYKFSCLH